MTLPCSLKEGHDTRFCAWKENARWEDGGEAWDAETQTRESAALQPVLMCGVWGPRAPSVPAPHAPLRGLRTQTASVPQSTLNITRKRHVNASATSSKLPTSHHSEQDTVIALLWLLICIIFTSPKPYNLPKTFICKCIPTFGNKYKINPLKPWRQLPNGIHNKNGNYINWEQHSRQRGKEFYEYLLQLH